MSIATMICFFTTRSSLSQQPSKADPNLIYVWRQSAIKRPNSSRRSARGPAGQATNEVRVGGEPQDHEVSRPHHPAVGPLARQRHRRAVLAAVHFLAFRSAPCKFPSLESSGRGHRSSEETEPCSEKRSLALPPPPQSVQRSLLPQLLHRPNTGGGTVAADTVEVWVVDMRWVVVTALVEASTAG